jgi:hypothetical protein
VELTELEALASRIVDWAGQLAAGTASWLAMIARFDEAEGWARWECASCAQWLNWQCGLDVRAAREHVRVARQLQGLPVLRAAFGRGEVSYSKVRALTRVAEPDTEADLLMSARHSTAAQLERIVAACVRVGRTLSEDEARARHDARRVSIGWGRRRVDDDFGATRTDELVVNKTSRAQLLDLLGRLVDRSAQPTLRLPARRPWPTSSWPRSMRPQHCHRHPAETSAQSGAPQRNTSAGDPPAATQAAARPDPSTASARSTAAAPTRPRSTSDPVDPG